MTNEQIKERLTTLAAQKAAIEVQQSILELLLESRMNPTRAKAVAQTVPLMVAAAN